MKVYKKKKKKKLEPEVITLKLLDGRKGETDRSLGKTI